MEVEDKIENLQDENAGMIFCWGWGEAGQLGRGNTIDIDQPSQLKYLSGQRIGSVYCGLSHSVAISDAGTAWVWGKGKYGRLGNGTERDAFIPTPLTLASKKRFISGACGGFHTALISSKKELITFGRGDKGQTGQGQGDVLLPTVVPFFKDKKVSKVACGNAHTLVLTESGELYAFGDNERSQCGTSVATTEPVVVPTKIDHPEISGNRIAFIACGANHSFVVVVGVDGLRKVFSWGWNDNGQCGLDSDNKIIATPTEIKVLSKKDIGQIAAGHAHSAAISLIGSVYTWGNGNNGQLGYGAMAEVLAGSVSSTDGIFAKSPQRVKGALFSKRVVDVACGAYHTVVLTDKGEIYAFGLGDKGQLGLGPTTNNKTEPAILRGALQKEYIFKIAAGGRHNLAATNYLPIIRIDKSTLSKDFEKLVGSKDFSDVELKIKSGGIINGHKIMLARSSVFKTLALQMTKDQRVLKFGDVRLDVLTCIVKYLYSDIVDLKIDPNFKDDTKTEEEKREAFAVLLVDVAQKCEIPLLKAKAASPSSMFPLTLSSSMANFVDNPTFSDIKFTCNDGVTICAHKAVLGARAERWRAMFLDGFVESRMSTIDVPISSSVYRSLLRYIYTDELVVEPEDSVALLMAANEYGQERLKMMCEDYIEKGIDTENVAWLLEIADQNGANQLKKFAFYYLLKEFDAVSQTEAYANLTPSTLEMIGSLRKPKSKAGEDEKKNCTVQ